MKKTDIFNDKQKRNRSGYDTDKQVIHSKESASAFIEAEEPIFLLGGCNQLVFNKDEESKLYAQHSATTSEIRELCKDLKVLGKSDFNHLLKWRKKMMAYKAEIMAENEPEEEEEEETEKELTPEEKEKLEEEKLTEQLQFLQAKKVLEARKEKRKRKEYDSKQKKRRELNVHAATGLVDSAAEAGLFSLDQIRDMEFLEKVTGEAKTKKKSKKKKKRGADDSDSDSGDESEDLTNALVGGNDDGIMQEPVVESDDDNELAYYERMEEDLDSSWKEFKKRRSIMMKKEKLKRQRLGLEEEDKDVDLNAKPDLDDLELSDDEVNNNALEVNVGRVDKTDDDVSATQRAKRWYSRDLFAGLDDEEGVDDADKEAAKTVSNKSKKKAKDVKAAPAPAAEPQNIFLAAVKNTRKMEDSDDEGESADLNTSTASDKSMLLRPGKKANDDDDDDEFDPVIRDFEEVPAENHSDSEDWSEYSDDDDATAEVMAMGRMMIRKKSRNKLINDAYNRYSFNDADTLPEWFVNEENQHNVKQMPMSKTEVDLYKEQLKAINARPMKKIAEAKARKKKSAVMRWEKMKQKAETISNQEGLSSDEKLKQIAKLYRKGKPTKEKVVKHYMVTNRNRGVLASKLNHVSGAKVRRVKVDSRMKSDRRGEKRKAEGRTKKKGKNGKATQRKRSKR